MATAEVIFQRASADIGSVGTVGAPSVCPVCIGPLTSGFANCNSCDRLLRGGLPEDLVSRIVPMTTALNPSPWYSRLTSYKRGNIEAGRDLAVLTKLYLERHWPDLAASLDRQIQLVIPVPSKRNPRPPTEQPLYKLLWAVGFLRQHLGTPMAFRGELRGRLLDYEPGRFAVEAKAVEGRSIVLVEDTWVSGATATSAAGALLVHGASSVVIVPLARMINDDWLGKDHPYRRTLERPFDLDHWPR